MRFAYVATKAGVFVIAAIATWPLARVIGPNAWIGLGVFGLVLTVLTVAVLSAGSTTVTKGAEDEDEPDPTQPFKIQVEDSIDLHSFPPRDVPDVVDAYLEEAVEKGFSEVRLIHGRGIGVQRDRVQNLLARHSLVSGFHDAPPDRGGWGATVAYLKPRPTNSHE
jgi:dsDNA-specific endonuclease/ATPase MutS2